MTLQLTRRRFTAGEYHQMARAGILTEDDRVELIDGEIVEMTPIGWRHLACVDRLAELFIRGLGEKVIVRVQGSIRLSEHSEPQPDLVLLRRRPDFYASRAARPEDTLLVVEVAESSLPYDRDVKAPLYARAGIPEIWLVNLTEESLTVYREPGPEAYRNVSVVRGNARLSPQAFPEFGLTPDQILG
jgi:Uma2 family endonuclease